MTAETRLWLRPIHATALQAEAGGLDWLSAEEARRLATISAPARRASFVAGHWLARQQAAEWLQLPAARIMLGQHADGRPRLWVDDTPAALQVSLSHSGDWLALALATVAVGVDIELPRRQRNLDALARFTFSSDENSRLQALDAAERPAAFHRLWTLLEARGKRSGEGLLPGQTRQITTHACAIAQADALSWEFEDGAVALAVAAGTRVGIAPQALSEARGWRYQHAGD